MRIWTGIITFVLMLLTTSVGYGQIASEYSEPMEESSFEQTFEGHDWESSTFDSEFSSDTDLSTQNELTYSNPMSVAPAPPTVPQEVPLPGIIWLLLAGCGLGAYSLRGA